MQVDHCRIPGRSRSRGLALYPPARSPQFSRVPDRRSRAVFRRITLPLAKMSFLTAAVLAFTHTVGEFGVVLMIGGDIPGVTRTLSISIFDQVQELNYAAANRTSLLLIAGSFLALLALYARRSGQRDTDA